MVSNIVNIWRKEMMDSVRDRRALIQALAIPLFLGIFYAIINPALNSLFESRSSEPINLAIQGAENAPPEFVAILEQFDINLLPFEGDLIDAVQRGVEPAGIIVSPDFATAVAGERPAALTVYHNPVSGGPFGSSISLERIRFAITTYDQQLVATRMQTRDIEPTLLAPTAVTFENLATPEQRAGASAALFLPVLVGILAAQGGLFIALDVTAGERERGTLEALLVTPASDNEIFLGKYAAVSTLGALPVILTFVGYWVAGNLLPESMTEGAILPFNIVLAAIAITLPLALLANVIMMLIAIRASAFKDAQSSVSPIIFLFMIPSFIAGFVPPETAVSFLIPIYGAAGAVGALASGGVVPPLAIPLSLAGSFAAVAVGLAIALFLFDRERLLYSA